MRKVTQLLSHFPVRLGLYALIEGLVLHGLVLSITQGHPAVFGEDGIIEWFHFSLMLAAAGLFLWSWRRSGALSPILLLCSMLAFVAALRELDHYSEIVLFEDAYKYPVALIAFAATYVLWKHWNELGGYIGDFSKEPAFYFLFFGAFLTAIVAQILGQGEPWQALIEGSGARTVKRVVEESLETTGYVLLFLGALESFAIPKKGG